MEKMSYTPSVVEKTCHPECNAYQSNIVNNLIRVFYIFWTNKCDLQIPPEVEDKEEVSSLFSIWANLLAKTVEYGFVPLLIGVGWGLTISKHQNIYKDKNGKIVAGETVVTNSRGFSKVVRFLETEVYNNKIYKKQILEELFWTNPLNISYFDPIEAIVFQFNYEGTPLLCDLREVLVKIEKLSQVDDKNIQNSLVIFKGTTDEPITQEQANSFNIVRTACGQGVFLITTNKDVPNNFLSNVKTDLTNSIDNWPNIRSALEFWIGNYFKWSGIDFETELKARQNLVDSSKRVAISNSFEKVFVTWVQKFIYKFNKRFKTKISISVNDTLQLTQQIRQNNPTLIDDILQLAPNFNQEEQNYVTQ